MATDLTLAARLMLDSRQWAQGLSGAQRQTRGFVGFVKREVADLRGFMQSTTGKLASLGAGFSTMQQVVKSANVDQQLTQIKQTAGLTADQVGVLRERLHELSGDSGIAFGGLMEGFGNLVAGGLNFDQALPTIDAINTAMRVTKSEANTLVGALQMAATHFDFDLSQPGVALELLDKMTVAGRAGVIEIEDLSTAFAASAANAKRAGLSFEETLALYEGFGTATTKERLGTLVSSTLAVFTNARYMRDAQEATGVQFFDAQGNRRAALEVIADIKRTYDTLGTERERFEFVSKAFGQTDKDTITGITEALKEGKLEQILSVVDEMNRAGGTLQGNLNESMDNAVAQAQKLRERMSAAADAFAQPVNAAFTRASKLLVGRKEEGGLDLSGGQLAAGGAGLLGLAFLGRKLPGKLGGTISGLLGGGASLGAGVAMGTALEKAGAATPVFIVGAAPGVFSGPAVGSGLGEAVGTAGRIAGRRIGTGGLLALLARGVGGTGIGTLAGAGAAGAGAIAAGVGSAALTGWGVGSLIHKAMEGTAASDAIGSAIARALAAFGHDGAREAVATTDKLQVQIEIDDQRSRVAGVRVTGRDADATVGVHRGSLSQNLGRMMSPGVY